MLIPIAWLLLVSIFFIPSVSASDIMILNDNRCTRQEMAAINNILSFVELDKAAIGLSHIPFNELIVGEKIYRYVFTQDGYQQDGYSYPIIYAGNVVLIATSNGNQNFQITTYEAKHIQQHGLEHVAFVYDANGFYLYNGARFILVNQHDNQNDERSSLCASIDLQNTSTDASTQNSQFNTLHTSDLSHAYSLGYAEAYGQMASPLDGYYSATVDFVGTDGAPLCWAACVAMVANYVKNENFTLQDVLDDQQVDESDPGRNLLEICLLLREESSTFFCDTEYINRDTPMSDDGIQNALSRGRPIIAGFLRTGGNPGHHAVVIDAIHRNSGYVRLCDPNVGRIYSYRFTEDESQSYYGEYYYTNPENNYRYYWEAQVSVRTES